VLEAFKNVVLVSSARILSSTRIERILEAFNSVLRRIDSITNKAISIATVVSLAKL